MNYPVVFRRALSLAAIAALCAAALAYCFASLAGVAHADGPGTGRALGLELAGQPS